MRRKVSPSQPGRTTCCRPAQHCILSRGHRLQGGRARSIRRQAAQGGHEPRGAAGCMPQVTSACNQQVAADLKVHSPWPGLLRAQPLPREGAAVRADPGRLQGPAQRPPGHAGLLLGRQADRHAGRCCSVLASCCLHSGSSACDLCNAEAGAVVSTLPVQHCV